MLQVLETPSARRRPEDASELVWESQSCISEDNDTTVGAPPGLDQFLVDELLAQQLQQEENMGDMGRSSDDSWRLLTQQMLRLQFQQFGHHVPYATSISSSRPLPVPPDHDDDEISEESHSSDASSVTPDNDIIVVAEAPNPASPSLASCGICRDEHGDEWIISVKECNHSFCKVCLRSQVGYKLGEGRYPIFCPTCEATYSRAGYTSKEHRRKDSTPADLFPL